MSKRRRLAVGFAVAALALLAAPATAPAQFFPIAEEAGPGVTISGTGLARVEAPSRLNEVSIQRAVDAAGTSAAGRAMRDARRRAEAMAGAAGLELGAVTEVAVDDAFPQFGFPRSHCRRARGDGPARCRVPAFSAARATMTFAIVGGSDSSDAEVTVEAYGSASVRVEPRDRRSNRSIRQAVREARRAAIPTAAAAARRNVETATRSAGLALGGIVSLSEEQAFYPYDAGLGAFGPGRFCGVVRRPIFRRDPDTGRVRIVGRTRRRRCSVPPAITLRLEAVYEAR